MGYPLSILCDPKYIENGYRKPCVLLFSHCLSSNPFPYLKKRCWPPIRHNCYGKNPTGVSTTSQNIPSRNMSLQHRFLSACGSWIEFLDGKVTVRSHLYAAQHSQKPVDQRSCFSLFSHRPIYFRHRKTSDSDSTHPTTSKTRIIEKLDSHWFLVE